MYVPISAMWAKTTKGTCFFVFSASWNMWTQLKTRVFLHVRPFRYHFCACLGAFARPALGELLKTRMFLGSISLRLDKTRLIKVTKRLKPGWGFVGIENTYVLRSRGARIQGKRLNSRAFLRLQVVPPVPQKWSKIKWLENT